MDSFASAFLGDELDLPGFDEVHAIAHSIFRKDNGVFVVVFALQALNDGVQHLLAQTVEEGNVAEIAFQG